MTKIAPVISASALMTNSACPDWRIIDTRFNLMNPAQGRQDWLSGHIPGAVYADLDKDLAGAVTAVSGRHPLPEPEQFAATLGAWDISNDSMVVVYDASGGAIAARAWWMLRWLGHERVALLDGGYPAWLDAGGAVEQGEVAHGRCHFVATPRSKLVITTEELMTELSRTNFKLLDARDAARFRGEVEPIDTRAGHVPGALNVPFGDNLRADGCFRSPRKLRSTVEEALGAAGDQSWTVMCGSGVTACHLAVAADIAGLSPPRLYVGSWSEWIRDPDRPVEAAGSQ